ncbi:MAG: hypothetical protein LBT43_20955 [Prevotella sp.]|jgi:hypothetical protein|nr:hypothetical protein [Prevotella sp.]
MGSKGGLHYIKLITALLVLAGGAIALFTRSDLPASQNSIVQNVTSSGNNSVTINNSSFNNSTNIAYASSGGRAYIGTDWQPIVLIVSLVLAFALFVLKKNHKI